MKTMMKSIVVTILTGATATALTVTGIEVLENVSALTEKNILAAETSVIADENGFEADGIAEAETVDETGTVISDLTADAYSGLYESGDAAAEDSMPGETAEAADGAVGGTDDAAGETSESRTDSAGKESTENTGASGSTAKADTGTSDPTVKTGTDTTSGSTAKTDGDISGNINFTAENSAGNTGTSDSTAQTATGTSGSTVKTDTSAGTGTSGDATAERKVYQCYGCDFITLDKAVMSKHVSDNGHITCTVSNAPGEALKQKAAVADAARQQAEKEAEQIAAEKEATEKAAAEKKAAEQAAAEEAARQAAAEQAAAEEAARQAAAEQAAAEEAARQAAAEKEAAEKEAAEKAAGEQGKFEWFCDRCRQTFVVTGAECQQHAQAHLAEEGKTVYYNCNCGYETDDFDAMAWHCVNANKEGKPYTDATGASVTIHSYSSFTR